MLRKLKNLLRTRTKPVTALEALAHVKKAVTRLNISSPADDIDIGYDMAIDEIIDLISDYEKALSTPIVRDT